MFRWAYGEIGVSVGIGVGEGTGVSVGGAVGTEKIGFTMMVTSAPVSPIWFETNSE